MSDPDEPDSADGPDGRRPMRDLLLAQAIEACIAAERELSGSSEEIIARQPVWARRELRQAVDMARSLEAITTNAAISNEFRVNLRARIMRQIGAELTAVSAESSTPSEPGSPIQAQSAVQPSSARPVRRLTAVPNHSEQAQTVLIAPVRPRIGGLQTARTGPSRRRSRWVWRGVASLVAAVLGVVATLTASASALPGEPLYSLKQAREDLEVRLATDDHARSLALLRLGDARLAETTRLLQLGRTSLVTETTHRYDDVVQRATTSFVVGVDDALPDSSTASTGPLDSKLSQQQDQLEALLRTAPEQARADLREALVATERSRAIVAEPRPEERVASGSQVAAAVPTLAAPLPTVPSQDRSSTAATLPTPPADNSPTAAPTQAPVVVAASASDPLPALSPVAQSGASHTATLADPSDDGETASAFETASPIRSAGRVTGANDDDGPPPADAGKLERSVNVTPPPARSASGETQMASNLPAKPVPAQPTAVVTDDDLETGGMVADGQTPKGLDALLMRSGTGAQVVSKTTDPGTRSNAVRAPSGDRPATNPTLPTPPSTNPTLSVTARTVLRPQSTSDARPTLFAVRNDQQNLKDDAQRRAAAAATQAVAAQPATSVAATGASEMRTTIATTARSGGGDASTAPIRAVDPQARTSAVAATVKSEAPAPSNAAPSNAAPAKRAGVEAAAKANTNRPPSSAAPARQSGAQAAGVGRR